MKGSKLFPQCGFSNTAVQVMQACDAEFEAFDVFADENIRQGIKTFSDWPTIPQLYVDGEFVFTGCADGIAREMDVETGTVIKRYLFWDSVNSLYVRGDTMWAGCGASMFYGYGKVRKLNVNTGRVLMEWLHGVRAQSVVVKGRHLYIGCGDGSARKVLA